MDACWIVLPPLLPFLAAVTIGGLHFFDFIDGEQDEAVTSRIGLAAVGLAALTALGLWLAGLYGLSTEERAIFAAAADRDAIFRELFAS